MRYFLSLLFFSILFLTGCSSKHTHDHDHKPMKEPQMKYKVLLWSKTSWYRHPTIPELNGWLCRYLGQNGIEVDISESGKDINPKNLKQYDALILSSTTDIGNSLDDKQKKAFIDWFEGGGALVGLHACLVHHKHWDWFSDLAGCDFDSDSANVSTTLVVEPSAKGHPALVGETNTFTFTHEWLNFDKAVTDLPGVQVLLRVDETSFDPVRPFFKERGGKPMGDDHPVSWVRKYKGGTFFYTAIGHDRVTTDTEFSRQHILNGLLWTIQNK